MDTILDTGIPIIQFLQSLGSVFIGLMKVFTFLGNEEFYLLVMPVLYWCVSTSLGLRVGVILMFSGISNSYLKWIMHLPRPYWYSSDVQAFTSETSFGAPSGHSQNAVSVWGLLAASYKRRWGWIAVILVIFLIGLSRMALGVHFHLDVLTGWTFGIVLLWGFLKLEKPAGQWLKRQNLASKVAAIFGVSLALILIGVLIVTALGNWQLPAAWQQNAAAAVPDGDPIAPLALSGMVSNAAALFGLAAGYVLIEARGGFDAGGPLEKRLLRYFLGLIGVLLFWKGLDLIFPEGETMVALIFRYLRYTLTTLWLSFGAPWLFLKMGLAQSAKKQKKSQTHRSRAGRA
jgi:membrane-associated phospholipid phosphatase